MGIKLNTPVIVTYTNFAVVVITDETRFVVRISVAATGTLQPVTISIGAGVHQTTGIGPDMFVRIST